MDRYAQMSDIPFARIKDLEEDAKMRSHCDILLFRSVIKRLDNLEAAQNLRQQDEDVERVANSKPTSNSDQIRSSAPAGGLMEMLADVWSEGRPMHPAARRAAIRKVAEWLRSKSEGHLGSGQYWSQRMEEEASRG